MDNLFHNEFETWDCLISLWFFKYITLYPYNSLVLGEKMCKIKFMMSIKKKKSLGWKLQLQYKFTVHKWKRPIEKKIILIKKKSIITPLKKYYFHICPKTLDSFKLHSLNFKNSHFIPEFWIYLTYLLEFL